MLSAILAAVFTLIPPVVDRIEGGVAVLASRFGDVVATCPPGSAREGAPLPQGCYGFALVSDGGYVFSGETYGENSPDFGE